MNIQATKLRVGMIIMYQNELHRVTDIQHLTPGNKRGLVQTKMKRLKDGISAENRFRSDDTVEKAVLEQRKMQYLYSQNGMYHFMDTENYEQIAMSDEMLGENVDFLLADTMVMVEMHENSPIGIELPKTVDLKVVSTEAVIKGATATSSYKPAELESGITVQVPTFIKDGDIIRVDTGTKEYVERVSK